MLQTTWNTNETFTTMMLKHDFQTTKMYIETMIPQLHKTQTTPKWQSSFSFAGGIPVDWLAEMSQS